MDFDTHLKTLIKIITIDTGTQTYRLLYLFLFKCNCKTLQCIVGKHHELQLLTTTGKTIDEPNTYIWYFPLYIKITYYNKNMDGKY